MKKFIDKHAHKITGTISCFDRIIFKGYLPLGWSGAMEQFLNSRGILIKDFKQFVPKQAQRIKDHAKALAERTGRPYVHLNHTLRKEQCARKIAATDGITRGLVCILAAVEGCQSFKIAYGKGCPKIVPAPRKCLCLYYYFIDRELGFMHVRIPTWFPFAIQIYLNGHDCLARKMDYHGLKYRKLDNAFLWIEDPRRAQHFSDNFIKKNWPRILSAIARRVNPLMNDLLKPMDYYWVCDQAEYATDVMFCNRAALSGLYENMLKHATLCFSAEDVMTFLGRKLYGQFKGEIATDYKKRWPGARIKHRMTGNWIKMYDKHGSVLRIETVINRPKEFKVRRFGIRRGQPVIGWFPMAKGVANLYRYAEVCQAANQRYLAALAVVEDTSHARQAIKKTAQPIRRGGRSYRGFNPAAESDVRLFAVVMRGEHLIAGFRNRDIRQHMYKPPKIPEHRRRQSSRVSRLLKILHVHGFVAKIPRSHRWRATAQGQAIMAAILRLHHQDYPHMIANKAA